MLSARSPSTWRASSLFGFTVAAMLAMLSASVGSGSRPFEFVTHFHAASTALSIVAAASASAQMKIRWKSYTDQTASQPDAQPVTRSCCCTCHQYASRRSPGCRSPKLPSATADQSVRLRSSFASTMATTSPSSSTRIASGVALARPTATASPWRNFRCGMLMRRRAMRRIVSSASRPSAIAGLSNCSTLPARAARLRVTRSSRPP